ncbi:hypothetical protein Q5P01_018591 [Channa striata]|uniref:G-protein coupled receptors family 1 profile domain-containing protein n=1 Tax=Channa striata TaxID=64152 RepID=A0AA88S8J8_CHASR|nr:hypothetical protein Q5P01_018591 [Channa striata]
MVCSRLLLSVYIFTFLTGVPANILAFCTFCRKVRRKAAPIDVLLLNLTVSDLIFLAALPFKMKEAQDHMAWTMLYNLCPFSSFLFYVTIYNSTLLLTAVSVERYLGVAYPLSFVYIMPYVQWSKEIVDNGTSTHFAPSTCYLNFSSEELGILLPVRLELFVVLFCVPFLISCFCYINFILILSRLPNISRRRRLRAIGLALGTLAVFTVCFGPYNASHVVGFIHDGSESWRIEALLCSTLNACIDPFIFYFSSAAVRNMLKHCVRNIVAKLHILNCGRSPRGPNQGAAEKYKEAAPP